MAAEVTYDVKDLLDKMDRKLDRLSDAMAEQFRHKADAAELSALEHRFDRFERGEFTDATARKVRSMVDEQVGKAKDETWTMRDRINTTLGAFSGVGMLLLYVLIAFHVGGA